MKVQGYSFSCTKCLNLHVVSLPGFCIALLSKKMVISTICLINTVNTQTRFTKNIHRMHVFMKNWFMWWYHSALMFDYLSFCDAAAQSVGGAPGKYDLVLFFHKPTCYICAICLHVHVHIGAIMPAHICAHKNQHALHVHGHIGAIMPAHLCTLGVIMPYTHMHI